MNKEFWYVQIISIQVTGSYFTTQQITSTFISTSGMWKFLNPVTSLPAITFWIQDDRSVPHYAKVFLHPAVTKLERLS
jgi:hypothetical protein